MSSMKTPTISAVNYSESKAYTLCLMPLMTSRSKAHFENPSPGAVSVPLPHTGAISIHAPGRCTHHRTLECFSALFGSPKGPRTLKLPDADYQTTIRSFRLGPNYHPVNFQFLRAFLQTFSQRCSRCSAKFCAAWISDVIKQQHCSV